MATDPICRRAQTADERAVHLLAAMDRPSASDGEARAARWIADELRAVGLDAQVEAESAHGTYWWPIGLLNAAALWSLRLTRRGRRLRATVMACAAVAALVDDLDHRRRWFRRALLPHRATHNVTAVAGDADAQRAVVMVAHHDAAHSGAVFDPALPRALQARFPALYARGLFHPPLLWLTLLGPLLALVTALRERPVHGVRVLLVSTGSEGYDPEQRRDAADVAGELGIALAPDFRFSFASDAQIARHAGYRCMLVRSIDELRTPSNYHWPTDTADRIDYGTIADATAVVDGIIRRRAYASSSSS